MTVKELIKQLKTYPQDIPVALVNLDDDTNDSNEALKKGAIDVIDGWDEFEEEPTGKQFLAICHRNDIRSRED